VVNPAATATGFRRVLPAGRGAAASGAEVWAMRSRRPPKAHYVNAATNDLYPAWAVRLMTGNDPWRPAVGPKRKAGHDFIEISTERPAATAARMRFMYAVGSAPDKNSMARNRFITLDEGQCPTGLINAPAEALSLLLK